MSMCVCCEVKISPVVIMSMCVCVCVCRKHLTTAFLTVLLRGNYLNHLQKWWGYVPMEWQAISEGSLFEILICSPVP